MKKLLLFLGVVVSLPAFGFGQGYFVSKIALSARGIPAAGATVTVCSAAGTLIQTNVTLAPGCSPTVSIFQDVGLTVPQTNPFQADGLGNVGFYVAPGNYTYAITGPTVTPTLYVVTVPLVTGTSGLLSGSGTTNNITKWTGTFTLGNAGATDDGTIFNINDAFTNVNTLNATNINTSTVNSSGSGANQLISGGGIFCSGTGLVCTVAATTVSIGGQTYSAPQTNVTLNPADPTNPRIDVFEIDTTPAIGKITGTPAVSPVEPSIDPTSQWNLGFINVAAGESNIPVSTVTLYDENTGPPGEWTCAAGTGWNCADTTAPFSGTKDIQGLGTSASAAVTLTNTSTINLSAYSVLKLELQTQSAWTGQNEIWLTWYNGSTPVGGTVFTSSQAFGFNGGTTGTYQIVVVPISSFGVGSNLVNSLQIKWNTGGKNPTNKTIYLDSIQMQSNGIGGTGGQAGTVSSVAMTGDGTIFKSVVPGSPITSSGTLAPALVPVQPGFGLFGPVANQGSNVGYRQSVLCITNPCTINSVASGDMLVVLPLPATTGGWFFTAISASLGETYTLTGCVGAACYANAMLASSGNDVLSLTNWTSGDPWVIVELTGAATLSAANSASGAFPGNVTPFSNTDTVNPSATTDSYLLVVGQNGTCYPSSGMSVNPSSSLLTDLNSSNSQNTGRMWLFAPGSVSAQNFKFTISTGTGCHNAPQRWVLDITQAASAGSAPPSYRRATEGDLPASAISAIQSVQRFTIAAAVPLPSATTTNALSGSVTMPADGCPCRVLVQYGVFLSSTTSATWQVWVSDGTNSMAGLGSVTTDAHTPPINAAELSPVAYANNQAVTFTLKINPGTYAGGNTVQALATLGSIPENSWMTLTIMQSRN